jgi:hypothetical protein
VAPETETGDRRVLFSVSVLFPLVPKQLVEATASNPEVNPGKKRTTTDVLPCPLTMVALAGASHLYEVALATGLMLYVLSVAEQAPVAMPEIRPGTPGFAEEMVRLAVVTPEFSKPLFVAMAFTTVLHARPNGFVYKNVLLAPITGFAPLIE